jgi:hypothetical protein
MSEHGRTRKQHLRALPGRDIAAVIAAADGLDSHTLELLRGYLPPVMDKGKPGNSSGGP